MFKKLFKKHKGFTLLELIICILVLGILAGLAVPAYSSYTREAQVSGMVQEIDTLERAASVYFVENNSYPIGAAFVLEEGDLRNAIQSQESGDNLYVLDMDALSDSTTSLKNGHGDAVDNDIYLYSMETGNIYYAGGLEDSEGNAKFSVDGEYSVLNVNAGDIFLAPGENNVVPEASFTLTGYVDQDENITATLNGAELPLTIEETLVAANDYEKHYYEFTAEVEVDEDGLNVLVISNGLNVLVISTDAESLNYTFQIGSVDKTGNEPTTGNNVPDIDTFSKTYDGAGTAIYDIAETNDGGFIASGYANGAAWFFKTDSNGEKVFETTYGSMNYMYTIIQTEDGDYLSVGKHVNSSTDHDVIAIKITSSGSVSSVRNFGSSGHEEVSDICKTADGKYLVVGASDKGDGDISGGNSGSWDGLLLKLDQNGNLLESNTLGGSDRDKFYEVAKTVDNGFICVGESRSSNGDITDGNSGSYDILAIKLDENLNKVWCKTIGSSGTDKCSSVVSLSDNSCVIAGHTTGQGDDITEEGNGGYDVIVVKLDSEGNKVFDKKFGGPGNDYGYDIITTKDNGFIVDAKPAYAGGDVSEIKGEEDIWAIKIDSEGVLIKEETFGGSVGERVSKIINTSDSGVVFAGYTSSSDGDVLDNPSGTQKAWVFKLNENLEF